MLKDTIISAFNYDGTLLKWLKKVEDALQNASASEFRVNKKGNATISFSIVFANGNTLESGDIILQQGESVTNATIRQGHLILTLSNGNELDAGDLGAVTGFSINDSQHLIVTYQDGRTQDLGAIFTGNITITGNLTATGGIKGNTIEQESANELLNIGMSIGSGLTTEEIYSKFVVINGVAYIVFNYKIKNDTGSDVTIYSAGNAYINMISRTAEKVIDLAGFNVHETTSAANITSFKGFALSSDYSLLKEINCSLINTNAVNQAQINLSISGGLTVPNNSFIYFTGRTFLTLLG